MNSNFALEEAGKLQARIDMLRVKQDEPNEVLRALRVAYDKVCADYQAYTKKVSAADYITFKKIEDEIYVLSIARDGLLDRAKE